VRARWIRVEASSSEALLSGGALPRHGLGTLDLPDHDVLAGYVAMALFVLGAVWYVPWLLCLGYVRSSSLVARSVAALSVVVLAVLAVVLAAAAADAHAWVSVQTLLVWST